MSTDQTCNYKHAKCFHITTIVLLIAAIASSIWAGCQVVKMETMKVGGKENFAKLQEIMKSDMYKEQYAQQLDFMLQELNGTATDDMFGGEEFIDESALSGIVEETTTSGETVELSVDPSTNEIVVDESALSGIDQNEAVGE